MDHRSLLPNAVAAPSKKIVACHVVYGGAWAGVEVQVSTLLSQLKDQPDVGLCAIVFQDGKLSAELDGMGIPTLVLARQGNRWWTQFRECVRFLKEHQADILHSHQHRENLLSVLLGRYARIPILVQTQHGHPELFSGMAGVRRRILLAAERSATRHAVDKVIAVSAEVTRYLKTYLPPDRVEVVTNGISLRGIKCRLTSAEAKIRLGLPIDSLVVGTAARLETVKRLDLFLAVAQRLSQFLPHVRFVIAGKGSEEARMRSLIDRYRLQQQVFMLGHRDDIHDVLRAMDIMLMTSDREGIPMVVLEAMAIGVPVVARNVGGLGEVVEHETTGILVPGADVSRLAEACRLLLQDAALRSRFAHNGRRDVLEKYSAEANAAHILRLYRALALDKNVTHEMSAEYDVDFPQGMQ